MLDAKRTFDELIEHLAPDARTRDEVLRQPHLPAALQRRRRLAGVHRDRQALRPRRERRLRPARARHAAVAQRARLPRRARSASPASSRAARSRSSCARPGFGGRILGRGTGVAFGLLRRVTGVDLLEDLSVFFRALGGMIDGFAARADRVARAARGPGTTFLIVTSPRHDPVEEAIFFHRKLREARDAVRRRASSTACTRRRRSTASCPAALVDGAGRRARRPRGDRRRASWRRWPSATRPTSPTCARALGDPPLVVVPERQDDVHDVEGLAHVRAHLWGAVSPARPHQLPARRALTMSRLRSPSAASRRRGSVGLPADQAVRASRDARTCSTRACRPDARPSSSAIVVPTASRSGWRRAHDRHRHPPAGVAAPRNSTDQPASTERRWRTMRTAQRVQLALAGSPRSAATLPLAGRAAPAARPCARAAHSQTEVREVLVGHADLGAPLPAVADGMHGRRDQAEAHVVDAAAALEGIVDHALGRTLVGVQDAREQRGEQLFAHEPIQRPSAAGRQPLRFRPPARSRARPAARRRRAAGRAPGARRARRAAPRAGRRRARRPAPRPAARAAQAGDHAALHRDRPAQPLDQLLALGGHRADRRQALGQPLVADRVGLGQQRRGRTAASRSAPRAPCRARSRARSAAAPTPARRRAACAARRASRRPAADPRPRAREAVAARPGAARWRAGSRATARRPVRAQARRAERRLGVVPQAQRGLQPAQPAAGLLEARARRRPPSSASTATVAYSSPRSSGGASRSATPRTSASPSPSATSSDSITRPSTGVDDERQRAAGVGGVLQLARRRRRSARASKAKSVASAHIALRNACSAASAWARGSRPGARAARAPRGRPAGRAAAIEPLDGGDVGRQPAERAARARRGSGWVSGR